jgi:2-polyprenyl-6-methoxyphenol hydroxylase-like FAD-dependent oxidoreductase
VKAIVVGGGIGGLTAAIALRRAGVEAVVFERAEELREIGAGISLWSNAVKALKKLDVYEAIREVGGAELGGEVRSWRGEKIFKITAAQLKAKFGEANLALHRADLQGALLAALPQGTVRLGAEFVGFAEDGAVVVARFADGSEERGDLLVGADGLDSSVRAQLFGRSAPRYAGYTAWRGVADAGYGLVPEEAGLNLWGRGSEFGLVSIGRGRFYWFMTRNAPEGEAESAAGRKREVLDLLRGWYEPARTAVEATEESRILRNDIYDRDPLERWGAARVTLLGDAAHPMTPNLGQGACQAIEDAVVLARYLRSGDEVVPSLRLYETRRIPRTTYVVRRSRRAGRILQLENPLLCRLRDAVARSTSARAQLRQSERIARYEP